MALITLRGYLFSELGVGVGDIEVTAHAKNADGTWVGTPAATVTSSSTTGKWEMINLDTANAPETGVFGIRMENPATGQVRRIEGDSRMMFGQVIGASGGAPLANLSILQAHLADGIVNDTKMGTRVIDDAIATAYSDTGTLTQIVSWLGKVIRAITGEADWFTTPDITLAAAKTTLDSHTASIATHDTHVANTSNPHSVTAAQVGAPTAAFTTVDADGTALIADSVSDTLVFDAGTGISITGNAGTDTITITNTAPAGGSANAFGTVAVSGSSNVVADAANDTLTIIAGHGVDITTSAASDSVTIAVDETELTGLPIENESSSKLFGASGSQSLGAAYADLVSFTSLAAGVYLFIANIDVSFGAEGDAAMFQLMEDTTAITPEIVVGATQALEGTVCPHWIIVTTGTSTVKIQGKEIVGTSGSITNNRSSFAYVRLA